jgi:hypothetical protein
MRKYHENPPLDAVAGGAVNKEYDLNREKYLKSYNLYPAKVVTLKDPYRSGNIGIKITGVHEEGVTDRPQDTIFAPMLMPFGGGENYGFFAMPPIGSHVMVSFIDGDPKNPIILGAWQPQKRVVKNLNSPNEMETTLSGMGNLRALGSATSPNTMGSVPTNVNPVASVAPSLSGLASKAVSGALSKISPNATSMLSNFSPGDTSNLITGNIPNVKDVFNDMLSGKIGQVPGLSDAMKGMNNLMDEKFGETFTELTDTLADTANQAITSIYPKIAQGVSQVNTLTSKLTEQLTLATTLKSNILDAMNGAPGLLKKGLDNLQANLLNGGISAKITATLSSITSPQIAKMVNQNISSAMSKATSSITNMASINNTFNTVLGNVKIIDEIGLGNVNIADAAKGLANGSVDYVLAKFADPPSEQIFGPQCPLPYRNQLPARTLEEIGENLNEKTEKTDVNSCYLSLDKKDEKNGQYITPEPLCYMWKSPEGSSIEIDDTGYANETATEVKGIDNRGVRLTTKKGNLLHLVDEKGYEGILLRDKNNNYIWIDSTTNTIHLYAQNGVSEQIAADRNFECVNRRDVISGDRVQVIKKDKKDTVEGNTNNNISKNLVENVGGAWSISVHGNACIYSDQDVSVASARNCVIGGAIHTIVEGKRIDLNSGP